MSKTIDPNSHLPQETAAEYEVVNWVGGHRQIFGKFGIVDLKTLTIREAEILVKTKFSKIVKRTKAVAKAKKDKEP